MTHDVFISHAVEDKQVADRVCRALEEEGLRCWIAPRDIPPGRDYEESIVEAITSSRVLLLILSGHSNRSAHVKREVQCAFAEGSPTRVIPLRIEPVAYSRSLSYYLGSVQWIDASAPPLEEHLRRLVQQVRAEPATAADATPIDPGPEDSGRPSYFSFSIEREGDRFRVESASPRSRAVWWAALLAAALLLVAAVAFVAYRSLNRRGNGPVNANINANISPATPTPNTNRATPTPTPTPQVSPTPRPTRPPIRNLNLRIPANLRQLNVNRTRPQN